MSRVNISICYDDIDYWPCSLRNDIFGMIRKVLKSDFVMNWLREHKKYTGLWSGGIILAVKHISYCSTNGSPLNSFNIERMMYIYLCFLVDFQWLIIFNASCIDLHCFLIALFFSLCVCHIIFWILETTISTLGFFLNCSVLLQTDQKLRVCDICGAFLSVYDR